MDKAVLLVLLCVATLQFAAAKEDKKEKGKTEGEILVAFLYTSARVNHFNSWPKNYQLGRRNYNGNLPEQYTTIHIN